MTTVLKEHFANPAACLRRFPILCHGAFIVIAAALSDKVRRVHVDATQAGAAFLPDDLVYIPDFITQEEHDLLARECEGVLNHRKWEKGTGAVNAIFIGD